MRRHTRREILRAGGLSLFGLHLPTFLEARTHAAAASPRATSTSFGRAKSCILLFMWGGPAQQETWDLKPKAPEDVRGEFRPIATSVPGIEISEHFPRLAERADRLAIIRSLHHADVNHTTATHEILTGRPVPRQDSPFEEDWPHFGAVRARLRKSAEPIPFAQFRPTSTDGAPRFVEQSHGQGGGWLGPALRPLTIDEDPNSPEYQVQGLGLPDRSEYARVAGRTRLLAHLEGQIRSWAGQGSAGALSAYQARAFDLLAKRQVIEAFDLTREDPRLRDHYGRNPHGQSVLQARRLVEAGVPIVTVFWPNEGITNVSVYWDTHNRNFIDLKTRLMPPADQAFATLLDDLQARGLLDETLVVWTGEFGRTPRVGQSVVGGAGAGRDGRDHWPHCFTSVLAGAGVRGGMVHGSSDRWAAYPARDPVTPSDLAATVYHALGIDPAQEIRDPLGRPHRLCLGAPLSRVLI
jgi:hypothetical protein